MKVVVGISGGVDSAIAAYILKKEGHEVIGVYFDFCGYDNEEKDFESLENQLGIKIYKKDYRKEFADKVIKYFVSEYKKGSTPNPCAYCNGNMKFKMLYDAMIEYGADMMATGHYANVESIAVPENVNSVKNKEKNENGGQQSNGNNRRFFIKKSKNEQKDQSYMLYPLTQDELSHLIFPIGNMQKSDVRNLAKEIELIVAEKKDSQDVCFIKGIDYAEFIKQYDFGCDYKEKVSRGELKESDILEKPYLRKGEFVDSKGKILGYHEGIINYTIGQRKGLNIAFGERKFVLSIDAEKNQVVLGDNAELFSSDFKVKDVVYHKKTDIDDGINSKDNKSFIESLLSKICLVKETLPIVKLRYRHDGTKCIVKKEKDGTISCHLQDKVRAITRGQAAVFYDEDGSILFGGTIVL